MPIRFSLNSQNLPDFLLKIILHTIMFAMVYCALREFVLGLGSGDPFAAIMGFLIGLAYSIVAAVIFTCLYLGSICEKFVDGLFGGKKYLKKAPHTYGILTGLLAQQKFEEAVNEINTLLTDEKCRRDPRLARIILEFYADMLNQPQDAWEFGTAFFAQVPPPDVQPEENLRVLLLLDDLAAELGKREETRAILKKEFRHRRMPRHDLNALSKRLES